MAEAPDHPAGTGLRRDEQEWTSLDAESAPPAQDDTRAALAGDIGAVFGALLVLVGTFALAFVHFASDPIAQLAVLSVAGGVALAGARASRDLRPPAASNWLAAVGALLLSSCLVPASVKVGYGFTINQEGWILACLFLMVVCGSVCWWLRSRMAGALAAAAWVGLPAVLASTGAPEGAVWQLPFTQPIAQLVVWGTLSLMVMAVILIELGSRLAARRGWADRDATVGAVMISSTALGIALVAAAKLQGASWFYILPDRRRHRCDRDLRLATGTDVVGVGWKAVLCFRCDHGVPHQ